jgi:hypothetical protein
MDESLLVSPFSMMVCSAPLRVEHGAIPSVMRYDRETAVDGFTRDRGPQRRDTIVASLLGSAAHVSGASP